MKNYFEMHPVCKHVEIDWKCRETSKNSHEATQIVQFITTHEESAVVKDFGYQFWVRKSRGFEILWSYERKEKYIHHVEFGDDKIENALSFVERGLDKWDRVNEEEDALWA